MNQMVKIEKWICILTVNKIKKNGTNFEPGMTEKAYTDLVLFQLSSPESE